jgi:TonB-linked SusC/RagA family outer membrane protein
MRKILPLIVGLLVSISGLYAQVKTVTGKVTAAEDGFGLPGVNVVVKGTSKGVSTDPDGNYSISLEQAENTLVFSFVGYASQEVNVGNLTTLDVQLVSDAEQLEELVVIGYGTVKKSDLTGAVSTVKSGELTKIPSFSPVQALQGKVAGVQITSTSGAPGASAVVRIRGTGTFGSAAPIYVVDGVILDNIDFLNPSDIESMDVLKDASATAIYGSRGANGVIMVTTKKGKKGQEVPVISFSTEYSVQKLQKKIDLLNGTEFATIVNEFKPGTYNNVDVVPNTDWQDLIFETAPIYSANFSLTGSTERTDYYFGIGYFNQDGIIPKSNYERLTIKLNNTFHLNKAVRVGNNINITPYNQQNTNGNAPFVVYRAQPVVTPFQADGSYSEVPGVGNVLADIENTNSFNKGVRGVGNIYAEVDILEGLTFKTSIGIDVEYRKNKNFTPAFYVSPQQQNGTSDLTKENSDRTSWLWENTLTYNKQFGVHSVNAVVGFTTQESTSEQMVVGAENLIREGEDFWYINPDNINEALVENTVDLNQNYSMMSYLARVNYTYNQRYLLTATFRRDGSSKFLEENRWGNFPALAVGWNIINEDFMQDSKIFSNLKLRASWGIIGNEKIDYSRIYSAVLNGVGAVFGKAETVYPGSTYGVSGNPNLKWENTEQLDLGVEMGFFNDQLTTEIGYYQKNTQDILINLPVPGYLGNGEGAAITYNAGEVLNKGFEFDVKWSSQWRDLRYTIGALGSTVHNEALKVMNTGGGGDQLFNGSQTTRTAPGLPLGSFYGYVVDGIFQNQAELDAYPHNSQAGIGDLRFVDVNNDKVLNGFDRTNTGSPIPTFIWGFSLSLGYKSFDLSADFQGQSGNKIYNAKETVRPDLYNYEQHVWDRWTGEGTSNTEPRATAGGYNFLPSSRFIQDGSFTRLRNVTIGYNLPGDLAEKIRMKTARVYVRGTNLFTWTNFTGYSPEVAGSTDTQGGNLDRSIDNSTYPVTAIYSAGLNLTF